LDASQQSHIDLRTCSLQEFETLFTQHYKSLCYVAFKIVRNWEAAEDLAQEFFIRCWQGRDSLHIEESFIAYAVRSVRNRSLNYLQKEEVRQRHEGGSGSAGHEDPHTAATLQQQKDEQRARLLQAIEALPEQRRKVFVLVHFHQVTYGEAAEKLGLSLNTVKTHMKLAYSALRSSLLLFVIGLVLFF
jgi:RNA polymerase sigma-70 factor (family 1)